MPPLSPDAIKQYNKSDSHGIYREEKISCLKIHQQISIKIRNHLSGRRNGFILKKDIFIDLFKKHLRTH